MSKKMIDAVIWLDGLILKDGELMENITDMIEDNFCIKYPVKYEVNYEEVIDD